MYDLNHLANHLRSASLKKKDATFIHLHDDDQLISFEEFFQNAEKIASAANFFIRNMEEPASSETLVATNKPCVW